MLKILYTIPLVWASALLPAQTAEREVLANAGGITLNKRLLITAEGGAATIK